MKYFVSTNVTFFESISYFSPQGPVTASESIPLSLSVPLSIPALAPDVYSPISLTGTTELPALKAFRDFRYIYTHWPKFLSLNQFQTTLQWKVLLCHQYLPLILMFLLPSAKVNGLVLIILSLILFHMTVLLPLFADLPCLYPLYLYPGRMRRLYWYLPGSRLWMRRWMLLFLEELGSFCTER